jgi:hypothetical protein
MKLLTLPENVNKSRTSAGMLSLICTQFAHKKKNCLLPAETGLSKKKPEVK